MANEEIFEAAEAHGYQDDFGRWNFTDDELLDFVSEFYSKDFVKNLIELNIKNREVEAGLRKAGERALHLLENNWGQGCEGALKEWNETLEQMAEALENKIPRVVMKRASDIDLRGKR